MAKTWQDPRVPAADECVLRPVLEKHAREQPGKVFVRFADGTEWTYGHTLEITRRTAAGLQALGVRQGDHVNVWLPNGPDAIRVWFGLNWLGAVYVPVNVAYRGGILEHALRVSGARLMVVHAALTDRLADIDRHRLTDAVVLGGASAPLPGLVVHPPASIAPASGDPAPPEREIMPWDPMMIIYTSGTTGPSKGVLSSYLHVHTASCAWSVLTAQDRYLVSLPMFHVGGTNVVFAMLCLGGSVAVIDAFRTEEFWDVVRTHGVTQAALFGGMATLLAKRPPAADDRDHGLRGVMMIPLLEDAPAFSRRFGCDVYTLFSMTEISVPLISGPNPAALGSCGAVRPGNEVRIVDENDCEVAVGEVGELIVRTDRPWAMNSGYHGNPEATARAWRNGWFHTGDAFRRDADGNFFFVDRIKDAIRRRGENISSFEVEAEVTAHPHVQECAAVAVPSELGEDEVLVAVVPQPGVAFDPAQLVADLIPRMAHFMVPRYVRVVPELPKTPTGKVQKHLLRGDGVTADTFDREQAGIAVRRQRLA